MTEKEVKEKIGEKNWKDFVKFMRGQTIGMAEDGKADYYVDDVDNFLYKKRTGIKFFWD